MREPALIGLAESGQLTGKILKLRLMVIVLASDCPNVLHVSVNVAAANQLICLTSQAEGCSLERWNAHKGFLKANFRRLVQEVKAQRRGKQGTGDQSGQQRVEDEPARVAGGRHSCNDGGEESNGSRLGRTTSTSRTPPTRSTMNTRQPALKPIATIAALIRSELDLPSATSISETISMSMSALELAAVGTMTLKAKAIRVAQELDIPISEESQGGV